MAIALLTADPRFVNLDNAAKLLFWLDQGGADFVAHGMSGFVGAEAENPLNLKGAHTLLAGQHQMHDAEPVAKRLVRVLKDRARDNGEPIALHPACNRSTAI